MSWGEGEYDDRWDIPDHEYFCANCGTEIYYPYKWRNVDKSQSFTGDWNIIKSKIYIQTNEEGKHIRLCDCCDEFFTTQELIKLFLIDGMGPKGREKEKLKKWNKREEKKRQKTVEKFGRKIQVWELCSACGGVGSIEPKPGYSRKQCIECSNGKVTKLISIEELLSFAQ